MLRNRGLIDPERIDEYIARDGYRRGGQGAAGDDPGGDHRRGEKIGLRGRREAGFPPGKSGSLRTKRRER